MADAHEGLAEQFDGHAPAAGGGHAGHVDIPGDRGSVLRRPCSWAISSIATNTRRPSPRPATIRLLLYGTLNTAILLTSSLTMALAVHAARANNMRSALRFLLITSRWGLAFLAVKGLEYHKDLEEHLWPGPHFRTDLPPQAQIFWFLYWVMTGVHAIHVTVGVGVLSVIAWMTARGRFSAAYHTPVEVSALYWHFVDIIWIYLYPLLYLINRYSAS